MATSEGTLSGVVTDSVGNATLSGAKISIENAETEQTLSTTSDSSGAYEIQSISAGVYEFEVLLGGYVPLDGVTELSASTNPDFDADGVPNMASGPFATKLNFQLTKEEVTISGPTITGSM